MSPLAIDLETTGLEAHDVSVEVVGLAIACNDVSKYFHVKDNNELYEAIMDVLMETQVPLIAHNMMFDGAFLTRDYNNCKGVDAKYYTDFKFFNWYACTYTALRVLSSEGWYEQKYSLKLAQINLLGWKETNAVDLDAWLVANGYANAQGKPIKGEMWKAPPELLGKYCCLDAASTWSLWQLVLRPQAEKFKASAMMIHKYWVDEVKHLIAGQLLGIRIDGEQLRAYEVVLQGQIVEAHKAIVKLVRPAIDKYNNQILQQLLDTKPHELKKVKELRKEPKKYKRDGTITAGWQKWEVDRIEAETAEPELNKSFVRWGERVAKLKERIAAYDTITQDEIQEVGLFNFNSPKQKQWLFYDELKYEVIVWTDNKDNPQPATGGDALLGFGEVGKAFQKYGDLSKELTYVSKAVLFLQPHHWEEGEFLHFQFKAPGTITGRLSGTGGINLQQVPKTRGYLDCYTPREGHVWIDYDFAALEPTLLTETSRDKSLLKLYGPNAKPNDIYIFNGAAIPGIREEFIAEGYDPDNPTKEAISICKKKHKTLRGICKTLTLGASYGAGPSKIRESLALSGVIKSLAEVKAIHEAYWKLYVGTKEYNKFLERQWERTKGYVLNGIGRPICFDASRIKDLVNGTTQSGGHDVLQIGLEIYGSLLREAKIPYTPIIWDFHDESLIEVRVEDTDKVVEIIDETFRRLNKLLSNGNSVIKFKGSTTVCKTLSCAKLED